MKNIILLIGIIFISGCVGESYTAEDIENADPNEISKETALSMCNSRAKACSQEIPAVENSLKDACQKIYYYTGNATTLLETAKKFC